MLTYMRNQSKTWVKWIIFVAIAVVFIFWGGSAYWGSSMTRIAKIDRTIITPQQYNKAYEDALKNLQTRLGTYPTPDMIKQLDLKTKVLDQIIDEYVLTSEAERMKISVTDDELQQAIRSVPAFQQEGQFSADNYRRLLAYQRLTPKDFEELQRKDLVKMRLYNLITENVIVSPEEIKSYYKYKNDTYSLNYLTIDPQAYLKDVSVTDQEIGIYYDKHKEKFKVPSKVVLSYLDFSVERYMDKVSVTSEDISDYYSSHKDEFSAKPKVHGRHILLKVPQDAPATQVEEKRTMAQKIYAEIKGGGDFAELAKKYSEDPGTNSIGGDIGLVPRDSLPEPMGSSLYKMNKGDVIPPVRTSLGFHILKSEGKEEGTAAAIEEVSPVIAEKLKLQRAKIMAGDDANNSFKEIYEQGNVNLAAYAQAKGLQVKEIGPFSQGDNIGIAGSDEIMKNAFLYPKGEIGAVVDMQNGYMIYMVKDKIPARTPELSEIKDRAVADLKMSRALERAKAYAAGLAKNTQGLNAMAHLTTGEFNRSSYAIPQLGMIPGIKADLDKLKTPGIYTAGDKIYIVWQGMIKDADIRLASKDGLNQVKDELLSRKREMAVESFMEQARKRHKIVIDEDKLKDLR